MVQGKKALDVHTGISGLARTLQITDIWYMSIRSREYSIDSFRCQQNMRQKDRRVLLASFGESEEPDAGVGDLEKQPVDYRGRASLGMGTI